MYLLGLFLGSLVVVRNASAFVPKAGELIRPHRDEYGAHKNDLMMRNPVRSKISRQPRRRRQLAASQQQQRSWWDSLMVSWFKLPPPELSSHKSKRSSLGSADDDDRATIEQLRHSNAQLRAELVALRADMEKRGIVIISLDDDPTGSRLPSPKSFPDDLGNSNPQRTNPESGNKSQNSNQNKRSSALRRQVRLALLAGLWAGAVAVGGVFIPIAIAEGAADMVGWLDDHSGKVFPILPRRVGSWGRGFGRMDLGSVVKSGIQQRRTRDAVVAFVEAEARGAQTGDRGRRGGGVGRYGALNAPASFVPLAAEVREVRPRKRRLVEFGHQHWID